MSKMGFFVVSASITVFVAFVFWSSHIEYKRLQEDKKHQQQLSNEFLSNIEKAKRETGDECSQVFVDLLKPPAGLTAKPVLVIMGQEIYLDVEEPSRRMWRMDYQLIPKGDKVELWKTQWLGVAMPPNNQDIRRQKLAEKYSPDSSRCRAK